jgi:hypothetical protein
MKFFYMGLLLCSTSLFAQSSEEIRFQKEQMRMQYEEQQRMQREMDSMRQKDLYLKALDQTLQGMERVSTERTAKSKAKVNEALGKMKVGRGQNKIFIFDFTRMKRHEFNMPLGGKDERYSCFYTKKRPISFHTVAKDDKIMSEIKFDLTNIGMKEEKLSIFVKGRNVEASFEVPKNGFRRSQNFRDGFIKLNSDVKSTNDPKLILKNNSEVSFNVCGETDLEGMPDTQSGQGGY